MSCIGVFQGCPAVQIPTDSPWCEGAASRAILKGFGIAPVFTKEGGSIPIVGFFKTMLSLDTLLIRLGQIDDNAHSPDERIRIGDFLNGCTTSAALLAEFAI